MKELIIKVWSAMFGLYFNQPITKTLQEFNVIPLAALVYCAWVCERIITLLTLATANGDDLGLGLATVYLGFLGTVVAAFIRAAMDIRANRRD